VLNINKLGHFCRRLTRRLPVAVLLFLALFMTALVAQDDSSRKVIARTAPVYPEMAKKMRLKGRVKVDVVISPRGSVISANMIGGNPVFEKSALDAVKQWRFESTDKETKATVVLEFAGEQ
jgi:TonB family protein